MSASLRGRVVVVTRPAPQSRELVSMLVGRGAVALVAPAIRVEPAEPAALREAARRASGGEFEWVVLTSRAGVEALLGALPPGSGLAARVAAVGEGTARALRERGVEPDLVPETYTTFALSRAMPRGEGKALLARADIAPGELEAAIASKGWRTERVDAYRTRLVTSLPGETLDALRAGRVDAVTFTSASTVEGFLLALGSAEVEPAPWPNVVCIGPVTARAATDRGLRVDGVARPHTIDGLVEALGRVLAPATGKDPA